MYKRLTTKEFIEKAKKKHGDKYDYSLVEYNKTKIKIICLNCIKSSRETKIEEILKNKLNEII